MGRELRLLEIVVEMDHHRVGDVLHILPFRHWVRGAGKLDASAAMRLAVKRFDLLGPGVAPDAQALIEQLEADANYFWLPTDRELEALGTGLSPDHRFRQAFLDHRSHRHWAVLSSPSSITATTEPPIGATHGVGAYLLGRRRSVKIAASPATRPPLSTLAGAPLGPHGRALTSRRTVLDSRRVRAVLHRCA